jgi:CheY-like chemotaxis protein
MKKITIFYVDDDQDDLDYFESAVSSIEKDVELYTHNHPEALLSALHNPPPHPHLLFVDLNMPGINGFEILENVRNSPKHQSLPVVIFSTSTDKNVIEKSKRLGASYYLPKPTNYSKLKQSIEHILQIDWKYFNPTMETFIYPNN